MIKSIRVGDTVQAFLDSTIKGMVVEIITQSGPWMVGGTAQKEMFCILEQKGGNRIKIKMSELHHSEY